MNFLNYIINKKNFKGVTTIFVAFLIFYFVINFNIVSLLATKNITIGPFDYTYFKFNIFNMDPIQLKDPSNSSIMHPLFNFVLLFMTPFKNNKESIYIVLLIQSIISSMNVILIYTYCSNLKLKIYISILVALFFGVFSYSINSTLVPDTYIYAQFFLILSVVYFQYCRKYEKYGILGHAILGVFNFGVTITNVIPYAISVVINKCERNTFKWIIKIIKSIILSLILIVILMFIEQYLWGNTFLTNWKGVLHSGGYSYATDFVLSKHWKIIYFMLTAPIITSPLRVMPGVDAIVTNISIAFPLYLKIITVCLLLLIILSIVINLKEKDTWILFTFVLLAIFLHVVKGFGLALFEYDMYLYAGHFIFIVPLYIALLFKKLQSKKICKLLIIILIIITIIILINNIFMQNVMLNLIKTTYL